MANISISLADEVEQRRLADDLRQRKHQVGLLPPLAAFDHPQKAAAAVAGSGAAVVVLDYQVEDAAGVKLLQAVSEGGNPPKFIFILPREADIPHIIMAMNEGASAVLAKPVNPESLANYIDRALSGPSRSRTQAENPNGLNRLESDFKKLAAKLAANYKLISYLLSTPPAEQRREALIVSDSAYQRDSLKTLLENHGFHAESAGNPGDGLELALKLRPRAIISDLEMEGKNGVEFCRDLKTNHKLIPCRFIICTANDDKIEKVMAPGNGVDACLRKPSNEIDYQALAAEAAMGLLLQE
ncbi:MAG: response regulator [Planctomycetota bacterium]|jgi:DNA-binding response OmpR family regulator|nr:response regulator [Planctomycetota bacterium]